MADLASAVAKLKAAGIKSVPNANQIASMPGLSPQEKQILVQASQNGTLSVILSGANAGTPGQVLQQAAVPQQAVQKRDVQPAGGPQAAERDYGSKAKGTLYNGPGAPTDEQALLDAAKKYNFNPSDVNMFRGMPAMPYTGGMLLGGNIQPPVIPPVQSGHYVDVRTPVAPSTPAYDPNASNVPGGSTYDSQVPQAAGGGPKFPYTPQTTSANGPSLTDILNGGGAGGTVAAMDAPDIYTPGAAPSLPDYSSVRTPSGIDFQFKRNPFTKEGKEMAKDVYAPEYETIDRLRNSANNQYSRSDKVIEQLYKGLADEVASSRKARSAEYDTEIKGTTDAGATAAQAVASGYDSGSKIMGQIMAGLGDRTSTVDPNSLQEMAKERGGDMADMTIDAQKAAETLRTNKNTQKDYAGNLGEAFQTQGKVSREDLIGQLNDTLGTYGNQELDLNSQERNSALALASQLSDWDWTSQQANYQTLQDQQANAWNQANWDRSNISDQYNNQWNQYTTGEQGRQFGSQQEWNAYDKALQNQIDAAKIAASANKGTGAGADPLDPAKYGNGVSEATASMYNYVNQFMPQAGFTGDDIQQSLSAAAGFLSPRMTQYTGMTGGQQKFIDDLLASQPNLPQSKKELLRIAADQYWNIMLKTDRTVPTP